MQFPSAWALDLDGVMWLADQPIAGSAQAVADLRANGHTVVFVTNFSFGTRAQIEMKLAEHGVEGEGQVITSSMAAASLVAEGARAKVIGGPGIVDELQRRNVEVLPLEQNDPVDALVVGLDPTFDYQRLTLASQVVRAGAQLIATNADPTYPTPQGPIPGGGSIVAAIATAAEVDPIIAGKPHAPIAQFVKQQIGDFGIMVGDRLDTDGAFATTLQWPFALVLSGSPQMSHSSKASAIEPEVVAHSLRDLVDMALHPHRHTK